MDPGLYPEGQCRLIIIGKTGNGKSATGNSILGFNAFDPQVGLNAKTRFGRLQSKDHNGIELQVMDTPGLHDTEVSDEVIADRITRSLLAISPGPHAVLLCLSCDQRFTKQELDVFETLKDLFGASMTSYLIVVMTKKDALDSGNVSFDDQLQGCTELKKLLNQANNRYVLFDNRPDLQQEKKTQQLDSLLCKVNEVVIRNGCMHFRHKMSAELDSAMEILNKVELNRLEQDVADVRPKLKPKPAPRMKTDPKTEDTSSSSSMKFLKENQMVTSKRQQFESLATEPQPQTTKPQDVGDKPTQQSKTQPEGAASSQSHAPPDKPPRQNQVKAEEDQGTKDFQKLIKQFEVLPGQGTKTSQEPALVGSVDYVVPDRPGMKMEHKQAMVNILLRRKLAEGAELSEEQTVELKKVSRSLGQKLREGMRKFKIATVANCRLM